MSVKHCWASRLHSIYLYIILTVKSSLGKETISFLFVFLCISWLDVCILRQDWESRKWLHRIWANQIIMKLSQYELRRYVFCWLHPQCCVWHAWRCRRSQACWWLAVCLGSHWILLRVSTLNSQRRRSTPWCRVDRRSIWWHHQSTFGSSEI